MIDLVLLHPPSVYDFRKVSVQLSGLASPPPSAELPEPPPHRKEETETWR
jgi:hypothetical protein